MDVTPLARPTTAVGTRLSIVVPFPSWPEVLVPQHFTAPEVVERTRVVATGADRADAARQTRNVTGEHSIDLQCRLRVSPTSCLPNTALDASR